MGRWQCCVCKKQNESQARGSRNEKANYCACGHFVCPKCINPPAEAPGVITKNNNINNKNGQGVQGKGKGKENAAGTGEEPESSKTAEARHQVKNPFRDPKY